MVLQRWQSVFLLIAAVLMAFFSYLPVMQLGSATAEYMISALGMTMEGIATTPDQALNSALAQTDYSWCIFILSVLIPLLLLTTIFVYKRLRLQKKLCMISCLLIITVYVVLTIGVINVYNGLSINSYQLMPAAFFPLLSLILVIMAYRSIRKDQKTLSSYDRIR